MKTTIFFFLFTIMAFHSSAQQQPVPLYPNGVPNSKPTPVTYKEQRDTASFLMKVTIPTITPYPADRSIANGTAVIVCPGGGYGGLAMDHEGDQVCKAFNKIGVTAFLLKYRLPSDSIMVDKTIGPLQDAQRAIQMVRQGAAQWGVNPGRIGIIGFQPVGIWRQPP